MGTGTVRKALYGILTVVILVGIIYSVAALLGGNDATPTPTDAPIPTESTTLAPTIGSLAAFFRSTGPSIELRDGGTAMSDIVSAVQTAQPAQQQAQRLLISGQSVASLADFLEFVVEGQQIPSYVKTILGKDWAVLVYGQREQFDQTGKPLTNSPGNRLIVIGEINNSSSGSQAVMDWESSDAAPLAGQVSALFQVDVTKALVNSFSAGTYRSFSVRYWNFPYADRSLDWSVITASNNKSYLIISGSRESMFFAIDQLMQ